MLLQMSRLRSCLAWSLKFQSDFQEVQHCFPICIQQTVGDKTEDNRMKTKKLLKLISTWFTVSLSWNYLFRIDKRWTGCKSFFLYFWCFPTRLVRPSGGIVGGFCWKRKAGLPLRPGHNQTAGMIANILGTLKKRRKDERNTKKG